MQIKPRLRRVAMLIGLLSLVLGGVALAAGGAQVPVQVFTLDNGMKFLLVPKPEMSTVAGGWVAHVGSSNEHPGITGISHFFEHMMFKGTSTIGTKDPKRDAQLIQEMEALQDRIRAGYVGQRVRWRAGEIADPFDPAARTPELVELEKQFQALVEEQRGLMIKDEFDQIYTAAGGSGINATTNHDSTIYFLTLPANKLELWFWMEADRLKNPVFREFYSERDVVHEERRLRTESTPTGKFDEMVEASFWESHPYHWPVVGWPSDLRSYTLAQANDYYATYYAPNNITVALVGNFDVAQVKQWATTYFGRIPRGKVAPPDVVTMEMPQIAEKRVKAECDCQPQVEIRYHTVPFMHPDAYALDLLEGLLNGNTGRLNKKLVLEDQIATSAFASQNSMKWSGSFSFGAETKGESTPAQLEAAWDAQVKRLIEEPIPPEELQKVKNNVAADTYRRLQNGFFLMLQLLFFDGLRDWSYLNVSSDKLMAVTADDIKRVAKTYLTPENRLVASYTRKAGSTAEAIPDELKDLPPQAVQRVMSQVKAIRAETNLQDLEQGLASMAQSKSQAPPQFQKALAFIEKALQERIAELKSGNGGGK